MPSSPRCPGLSLLTASLAALALCGCRPQIRSFIVSPPAVCPGDAAPTVTWDAVGDLSLTVTIDPAMTPDGAAGEGPPLLGSHLVALRLVAARNGQEAAATRWIEAFPPTFENEVSFSTALADDGVVARGTKNAARWSDRFEIATVASTEHRRIEVLHAGRQVALAADGAASEALAGTPLGGEWELRWRAADGGAVPDHLTVHAVVRCRKEKP